MIMIGDTTSENGGTSMTGIITDALQSRSTSPSVTHLRFTTVANVIVRSIMSCVSSAVLSMLAWLSTSCAARFREHVESHERLEQLSARSVTQPVFELVTASHQRLSVHKPRRVRPNPQCSFAGAACRVVLGWPACAGASAANEAPSTASRVTRVVVDWRAGPASVQVHSLISEALVYYPGVSPS